MRKTTKKQPEQNLFARLAEECAKLDEKGQAYLDRFEFLTVSQMADRVWDATAKAYHERGVNASGDWSAMPDWAQCGMLEDGIVPYTEPPRNGSLHVLLGYSMVSAEAHLRNLLERAEGRETAPLDFGILVPLDR